MDRHWYDVAAKSEEPRAFVSLAIYYSGGFEVVENIILAF